MREIQSSHHLPEVIKRQCDEVRFSGYLGKDCLKICRNLV
ncbi:MAG: hypothetical protein RL748_2931 [Pseudomonadota bacterium]|jgi:hypothetical protein